MSGGSGDVDCAKPVTDPQKVRSVTEAVKVKRTREQGVRLLPLLQKSGRLVVMLLVIWFIGYMGFSLTWVLMGTLVYTAIWEYRRVKKEASTSDLLTDEPETLLARVDELPRWVYYPDVERAEWLNKIILKMWPFIDVYVKKLLQKTVAPIINQALPTKLQPFMFETVDLGTLPPRVGGVKAYIDNTQRDEIILDVEVMFAGDATLKIKMHGLRAGVKDITITGMLRVIMKPLVGRIPILGGLSIYFLNQPKIDFDLTDIANVFELPLISVALRTIVNDQVANYLVLPNKIPIVLTEIEEALFMIPKGVLRVTVVKARNLKKADVGFLVKGKSDPYCKISVGAHVFTTKVVQNSVAPTWNESFEFVIDTEDTAKNLKIEVFDEDPGDDDFLGRTKISLSSVEEAGVKDLWSTLEGVETGEINLSCKWFDLIKDPAILEQPKSQGEPVEGSSTAILIVVVDSIKNLPSAISRKLKLGQALICEPSPFVRLQVGNSKQKTTIKESSTNPKWEDTFTFLISDANMQELNIEVIDSNVKTKKPIGVRKIPLKDLLSNPDMQVSRPYAMRNSGPDTSITLRLCLRALTQAKSVDDARVVKEPLPNNTVNEGKTVDQVDHVEKKEESAKTVVDYLQKEPEGNNNSSVDSGSLLRQRRPITTSSESPYGRIQLTLRYSVESSQLVVVVHHCVNLMPSETDNKADTYVRLYLLPDCSSSGKRKTKVSKDNLSPTYDETFYWRVAKTDVSSRTLEALVKNHVKLFAKGRVNKGLLRLNLSKYSDLAAKPHTEWYDLTDPDDGDVRE